MGIWSIDTVTVFNRYYDKTADVEKYIPTVITKCSLAVTKGRNTTLSGMESADAAKLYVYFKDMPKEYIKSAEWKRLTEDEKRKYLTFSAGEDFFVKGNHADESEQENLYEYMRNRYDDVYKITTVDEYKVILPHLEIGGV